LEIREAAAAHSFYLQTSEEEGMALSVVEAMQLALVPIVTPVGEIGSYCADGQNSVIVTDNQWAISNTLNLLANPGEFKRLSKNASARWNNHALYRDDVLTACEDLLNSPTQASGPLTHA
jgi:glycosyltransferase involved in cell wall biosynthesis